MSWGPCKHCEGKDHDYIQVIRCKDCGWLDETRRCEDGRAWCWNWAGYPLPEWYCWQGKPRKHYGPNKEADA